MVVIIVVVVAVVVVIVVDVIVVAVDVVVDDGFLDVVGVHPGDGVHVLGQLPQQLVALVGDLPPLGQGLLVQLKMVG